MTNWQTYKFCELVNIIGGGTPKTSNPEYWGGDIPWLSVVDFGGDRKKVYLTEKSISEKGLKESSTKLLKKGQLIISARGTVGELAVLGKDMAFNQSCYGLDAVPEKATNNFLYYLLKYKLNSLKAVTHGSVFDTITRQTFEQLEVEIPVEIEAQKKIAEILSAFDDKIELNRRMNQTLEQMAQTLFQQYFVIKINEDNLPDGWSKISLGEIIDIKHGYAFKGEFFSEEPTENILLTPGNFRIGGGFSSNKFKYYKGDISADYILELDDLIVTMTDLSKDGDTLGYPALVPIIPSKTLLHNQRLGKIIFKINAPIKYYLNWLLRSSDYRSFILGSATGTTVRHTSPSRILEYSCLLPPEELLLDFEQRCIALHQKEQSNNLENITLSNLRDTLLPKLMSGEIDVMQTKAEELYEPVLS